MKLKHIIENIITEIGDKSEVPPGSTFTVDEHFGKVEFRFEQEYYTIEVRVPVAILPKITISVDFYTGDKNDNMTNKHAALKVMSYITGCIEEWLIRYKEKFASEYDSIQVVYIKYNPKSEFSKDYKDSDGVNRRDRLYKIYIEKFAKKYESSVTWSTDGGVIAKFNPSIEIT